MYAADYAKGHQNNVVQALKFAGGGVLVGTSIVLSSLRRNGDNRHGCPKLHLETLESICQHASCTDTKQTNKPASKLRFFTPDKVSSMNTFWHEEEFEQICSRESTMEKAAEIEKTISVKEHERGRLDFDPAMFYENRFWNQKPDGIVIDKNHRTRMIHPRV